MTRFILSAISIFCLFAGCQKQSEAPPPSKDAESSFPPAATKPSEAPALPSGPFDAPIRSKDLLKERACVFIEHEGMLYALRTTRAGKLILTK